MKFEKIKGAQNNNLFRPFDKKKGVYRDVIWIRFYRAGKGRIEESLKTNLVSEARIARDKRIAEFLGEKPRHAGKGILVEDKFPEFLALKETKSQGTQEINETMWRLHLGPAFGHMLIEDVTENAWLSYVIEARKEIPGRIFGNSRKSLQNFVNWLHKSGDLKTCPKFEDVDPERNPGKVYDRNEIDSLLAGATEPIFSQIILAVEMAMRHGEIWSLEWSQINLKTGLIYLPAAKTKIRKSRAFIASEHGLKLLQSLHLAKNGPWVYPSPIDPEKPAGRHISNNQWKKLKKKTGIVGRFHDLRHTALTNMFKQAVNPALICDYAGLSLAEAQKTYLHFTPEDTKVVASLMKVGG